MAKKRSSDAQSQPNAAELGNVATDVTTESDEARQQRLEAQRAAWQAEIDAENDSVTLTDDVDAPSVVPSLPLPPPLPTGTLHGIRGYDPERPNEWFARTGAHLSVQLNWIELHFQRVGGNVAGKEPELATIKQEVLTHDFNTGEGSEKYSALVTVEKRRAEVRKKHADRRAALEEAKANPLADDALEQITALSGDEATEASIEAHWLDAECKAYDDYLEAFQAYARSRSLDVQNLLQARKAELANEIAATVSGLLDRLVDVHYSLSKAQHMVPDQIMPVGVPVRPVRKPDFRPSLPNENDLQVTPYIQRTAASFG